MTTEMSTSVLRNGSQKFRKYQDTWKRQYQCQTHRRRAKQQAGAAIFTQKMAALFFCP